MKRFFIIMLILISVVMMAACGSNPPTNSSTPTPKPTPTPTPVVSQSTEPTPPLAPEPKLSYTTGLAYEGEYKPVMVIIENSPAARPQTGLQTADVVYEVPVEGSITRFVCVFSDNVPEKVMPVRSGRVPFLYIQHEWDAVFMHYGGAGTKSDHSLYSFYGSDLFKKIKIEVDGNKDAKWTKKHYYDRVSGISAPHNVKGNPLLAQQLYDYSPAPLNWIFDSNVTYDTNEALELNLKMCSGDKNFISYKYDTVNDLYMRFMNGKKFICAETDAQLAVKNLVVQYSTYKALSNGKDTYKVWNLVGGGKADFHIGGKLIKGTWERKTEDDATVYYDDKGEQIVLKPGNTWIHISPEK